MTAHAVEQVAAANQLAADAGAEFRQRFFVAADLGEAGFRQHAAEAAEIDRLAHDADTDHVCPGRPQRFLDRRAGVAWQVAQRDHPDPLAGKAFAHQRRVDAAGEFVGAAQFAVQFVRPFAGVLEVAGEALLEVLARVGEGVATELGPDQDPDREGEEDGDQ